VKLDEKYHQRGLTILAFPCNQFGGQEPGTTQEIKDFVAEFGVQFRLMEKKNVNFSDARPLFLYLQNTLGGTLVNAIKWNFSKFLVDIEGTPIKRFSPKESPLSFEQDILKLLGQIKGTPVPDPWQ